MAGIKRASFLAATFLTLAIGACSSSSNETPAEGSSGATGANLNAANCPTWTQALDAYGGASVSHEGTSHAFTFALMDSMPAPPALGTMIWTLQILDASGQPVKDAKIIGIKTWMPQHMHPSTALPVPSNNGDGTYTINNLYLYMAGVWQVTITATSGSTTDSAMFTFCLGGGSAT